MRFSEPLIRKGDGTVGKHRPQISQFGLFQLKFIDSSFSSLSSYYKYTGSSLPSDSRQQYLSQQYPYPSYLISVSPGGQLSLGDIRGGVRSGWQDINVRVASVSFAHNLRFKQAQAIDDVSAAYVVIEFVSSEILRCRLLKLLLYHPPTRYSGCKRPSFPRSIKTNTTWKH